MDSKGQPNDLFEYRFRNWNGLVWDKGKVKRSETYKAALLVNEIKEFFNISNNYVDQILLEEVKKDLDQDLKPKAPVPQYRPFSNDWKTRPVRILK